MSGSRFGLYFPYGLVLALIVNTHKKTSVDNFRHHNDRYVLVMVYMIRLSYAHVNKHESMLYVVDLIPFSSLDRPLVIFHFQLCKAAFIGYLCYRLTLLLMK